MLAAPPAIVIIAENIETAVLGFVGAMGTLDVYPTSLEGGVIKGDTVGQEKFLEVHHSILGGRVGERGHRNAFPVYILITFPIQDLYLFFGDCGCKNSGQLFAALFYIVKP